jgi:hypothetical protein
MSDLIHDFIFISARRTPSAQALVHGDVRLDYAALADHVRRAAQIFLGAGLRRGERVAVYLEKRIDNVAAMFGASLAGAVFVRSWRRSWRGVPTCVRYCSPARRTWPPPPGCTPRWRYAAGTRRWPLPPRIWHRTAASMATSPPSCIPRAAPASRKAWCCRTGTW